MKLFTILQQISLVTFGLFAPGSLPPTPTSIPLSSFSFQYSTMTCNGNTEAGTASPVRLPFTTKPVQLHFDDPTGATAGCISQDLSTQFNSLTAPQCVSTPCPAYAQFTDINNNKTAWSANSESFLTVGQPPTCVDPSGNPIINLRVLDYTTTVPKLGLGRLLWTITAPNKIVNITATLNTTIVSTISGTDLGSVAGVNFTGPSTSGQYTLVVSATDINGCKADTKAVNRIINVP